MKDLLQKVFRGELFHPYYEESTRMYKEMKVHADGEFPETLIGERRPKEDERVFTYRKKIYQPITMEPMSKVENALSKIRKSPDWSVRHKPEAWSKRIVEEETPERYFEKEFPVYTYLGGWLFSEALRNYIIDPNAWEVLIPLELQTDATKYVRPYPHIFNSDKVLWTPTLEDNVLIIRGETIDQYEHFWVITDTEIAKYKKQSGGESLKVYSYMHKLGYIPGFKLRGVYLKSEGTNILYKSRFYAMMPHLNEAAREFSDLQAEVVQHIFSEPWEIRPADCKTCNGLGKHIENNITVTCKSCKGSGYDKSPYSILSINPSALKNMGTNLPIPPKGYVEKSTEIVKLQDERVDNHIYKALSAVELQFLGQVPLSQSGKAKEVDHDGGNNTVHSVAEDVVMILDMTYRMSIDMRYSVVEENKEKRYEYIPDIPVPERFDLLSASHLMAEIKEAKEAGIAPASMAELQIEYAIKKFYNNPEVGDMVVSIYELDPLPGYSQDEKMAMEMSGTALKADIIISNYLSPFVRRAIREDANFLQKDYEEKMEVLRAYAAEKEEKEDTRKLPVEEEFEEAA